MNHQHHNQHSHGKTGQHHSDHQHMVEDFKRRFWISLALTVPVLALAPLIQEVLGLEETLGFAGDSYVQFVLASLIFFYGGWPFITGLIDELRQKSPGMMTLIGLAIGVAYGYSSAVVFGVSGKVFFWELATLIDIMLLGHWIEMRSVMGASRALEKLVKLMPDSATLVHSDGSTEEISVSELKPQDRVLVKPGEKIPIDGEITEGRTSINQAMLTGESQPVEKGEGDEVIGGSINGESSITIEVQKTGEETYLSQVIAMVEKAQGSRSRTQDLADRAAFWLTVVAISAGSITLAVWLVAGQPFVFALERMVTVMVITCPHALGLAIPLVVAVSTTLSASSGLLIRDRAAFERARSINAIVFDKTGTLTEGRFGVSDIVTLDNHSETEVLRLAAGLENQSEHPIAAGIVREAKEREIKIPRTREFKAIAGKGAQALVDGSNIKVVSPGYLSEQDITISNADIERVANEGKTVVYVLLDDEPIGAIGLADIIREESRDAISKLKQMGVQVMMLTGDAEPVAQWVAKELELDDFFAEVLPDEKAQKIKEVKSRGLSVAMVGDGINDAPALVEADVGIAIGAGTDIAIESADIVLVKSDPRDVTAMMNLARATYGKMVQNLAWATGYNVVAIPLAAGVLFSMGILLSPAAGAALMSLSTVIVAINARMLKRAKNGA